MTSDAALKFIIKHWKEIMIAALSLAVIGKFRYDHKQLQLAYETSQQSLEEQIAGLKDIHQRELERRDEALQDYRDALAELERNYLESQQELERQKKETRRQYVEDFSGNQEQLIVEIEEVYGFTHVD
jgi:DNA repair exonuclease SbcCD ATPase subunit